MHRRRPLGIHVPSSNSSHWDAGSSGHDRSPRFPQLANGSSAT
jgi:hypothetical protein